VRIPTISNTSTPLRILEGSRRFAGEFLDISRGALECQSVAKGRS
jgi:hypothetical protein